MEIKVNTKWLFADNLEPKKKYLFEFVEAKAYIKDGKDKGQVFVILGEDKDYQGEFYVFPSKIDNLSELIKKLGTDDSKWAKQKFEVTADQSDKRFLFEPI